MKSVCIIGGGIGGLCTGIILLKNGYTVSLYEKNDHVGGVAHQAKSIDDNFNFQYAASIPIDPKSYDKIFEYTSVNPRDYFDIIKLNTNYKFFFQNGESFELTKNIEECSKSFEKFFNEPITNYKSFINHSYNKYLISDKAFLNKPFLYLRDILNAKTISSAIQINPIYNSYKYISKYIKNEKFRQCLLFQILYMGISPYDASNIYSTIPALTQVEGLIQIKGGIGAYTDALCKLFKELGGNINLKNPVNKILIQDNKCYGISCQNETIHSDIVVCNADYCYTLSNLIDPKSFHQNSNSYKTPNFKMSCSVFILHLELNKKFDCLCVHNHYISEKFKIEIEKIFSGIRPDNPPVYIYYPTSIENNFDRTNKSSMNIMIRVPNLCFDTIKWNKDTITKLKSICIKTLSNITGNNNIENHIIHEHYTTPVDLESDYNYYKGAAFGIAHTLYQSIAFRPQAQMKNINNLYFVGSSIHPGNGVSVVMKGANIVANQILST